MWNKKEALRGGPHTAKATFCAYPSHPEFPIVVIWEEITSSQWKWIVSSRAETFGLLAVCVLWHRIFGIKSGTFSHTGEKPDPPLPSTNRYIFVYVRTTYVCMYVCLPLMSICKSWKVIRRTTIFSVHFITSICNLMHLQLLKQIIIRVIRWTIQLPAGFLQIQ